ncbi:MAG: FAD-dependent oxidoreductase [Solirubrobacterales bacterium]|nr:FAD-dependent oxidoreductase [Solirubrobacterales bacterium]MBV9717368.1 FAD-dependent oxidoreductase [Solirubrobacterales bacterium]
MAEREVDFLIIGGGHAGYSCARALRDGGAQGSILLVSREPDPPYDRTACSKGYLGGSTSRDAVMLRSPEWWEEQNIRLLTRTSVLKLATDERRAALSNKDTVSFGSALVATGAMVRRLRVDGGQLNGIHYLRALGNADAIRRDVEPAEDIVLIGGSYIGTEVAATLTARGKRCTIVMQEDVVLERTFGREVGRAIQDLLEARGIAIHGGEEVDAFTGDGDRVGGVRTKQGLELPAQAVVVGAGVIPDVQLARSAGLELGESGGIKVDVRLATSAPGIFAAGDVAEFESEIHPAGRLRVEHWEVAAAQGRRAAAAMRGGELPEEEIPYFFSDLHDWLSYEYIGPAKTWDQVVMNGSIDKSDFSAWYLDRGAVAAVLVAGRPEELERGRRLFGKTVDPGELTSPRARPTAA